MSDLEQQAFAAMNRLAKWRTVFAGWQLGTRAKGDPESDAVRDQRELLLVMRAELNVMTRLLIEAKVFTQEQWHRAMIQECHQANDDLEKRFPGFRATADGITIDKRAADTTKGWKP